MVSTSRLRGNRCSAVGCWTIEGVGGKEKQLIEES
jgi:hypothetical protein